MTNWIKKRFTLKELFGRLEMKYKYRNMQTICLPIQEMRNFRGRLVDSDAYQRAKKEMSVDFVTVSEQWEFSGRLYTRQLVHKVPDPYKRGLKFISFSAQERITLKTES